MAEGEEGTGFLRKGLRQCVHVSAATGRLFLPHNDTREQKPLAKKEEQHRRQSGPN